MLKSRLIWDEGTRLRHAADLMQVGLPPEAVPEAFSILREEIDLLNRCRADVMPVYLRNSSVIGTRNRASLTKSVTVTTSPEAWGICPSIN